MSPEARQYTYSMAQLSRHFTFHPFQEPILRVWPAGRTTWTWTPREMPFIHSCSTPATLLENRLSASTPRQRRFPFRRFIQVRSNQSVDDLRRPGSFSLPRRMEEDSIN